MEVIENIVKLAEIDVKIDKNSVEKIINSTEPGKNGWNLFIEKIDNFYS